jgi:hypothetical protein
MMMRMLAAAGLPPMVDGLRSPDVDNPHGYFEFEPVKLTRDDPSWLDAAAGRAVKIVHLLLLDLPLDRSYGVVMMRRDLGEVIESQRKMLARAGKTSAPADVLRRVYDAQMAQVRRHLEGHACFRVLDVEYARVISAPLAEARRVAGFIGRGDAAAMVAGVDPSLYRNRVS